MKILHTTQSVFIEINSFHVWKKIFYLWKACDYATNKDETFDETFPFLQTFESDDSRGGEEEQPNQRIIILCMLPCKVSSKICFCKICGYKNSRFFEDSFSMFVVVDL